MFKEWMMSYYYKSKSSSLKLEYLIYQVLVEAHERLGGFRVEGAQVAFSLQVWLGSRGAVSLFHAADELVQLLLRVLV